LSPNALTPVAALYRDLRNMAVDQFAVHCIRRPFEPGIDESDDLTTELRDKSDAFFILLPVAGRYRLERRDRVALRIEAGVMLGAFQVGASDSLSIFGNGRTNEQALSSHTTATWS
jgi:hypothetical protein